MRGLVVNEEVNDFEADPRCWELEKEWIDREAEFVSAVAVSDANQT